MRLGLLADIHEHVEFLALAIERCRAGSADEFLALGDVFESGRRLDQTAALLLAQRTRGVWGNHDFGLCVDPDQRTLSKYGPATMRYFSAFTARIVLDDLLLQHVMPHRDPNLLEDLWHGPEDLPETDERRAQCFGGTRARVSIVGHFHRWLAATPGEVLDWDGREPLHLDAERRFLVVVDAVENGRCAILDTDRRVIEPIDMVTGR